MSANTLKPNARMNYITSTNRCEEFLFYYLVIFCYMFILFNSCLCPNVFILMSLCPNVFFHHYYLQYLFICTQMFLEYFRHLVFVLFVCVYDIFKIFVCLCTGMLYTLKIVAASKYNHISKYNFFEILASSKM